MAALRALVVDDEPEVLRFGGRALTALGFSADRASSAQEALDRLASESYDLLLTDLSMPGMNGLELIAAARERQPYLPVVVITGYGTMEMAVGALRAGADDFVLKPFDVADLRKATEHALGRARLLAEHGRLRTLFPLFELARRVGEHTEPAAFAREVLSVAVAETQSGGAWLVVAFDDKGPARLMARSGQTPEPLPEVERVWQLAPRGVPTDGSECAPALQAIMAESGVAAFACVPLATPHRAVGILTMVRTGEARPYGRADLDLLGVLGTQAAAALENMRLVAELQAWGRELEQRVEERTAELMRARDELLRAQRLAVIGELGASIAHEMRNPLGVISNSIYYLKQRLGGDDPAVARHLDIIEREVQASNGIVTELMSMVRDTRLEIRCVAPEKLVARCLERAEIPGSVHVTVRLPQHLPHVRVDPDKIELVFLNLFQNAVQAMPEGGELTIEAVASESEVAFGVRDSGHGIPEEDLERVFEPLYTTKARGIGLGLAIVRRLVDAHQGRVTVESQEGAGSVFTVSLPACSRREGAEPA